MSHVVRAGFFALFLVLFGSGVARAAEQVPFVQSLGDQAISILGDKTLSPAQKDDKFHTMLVQSFDLNTIGRFVLGRTWNAASDSQKQEYIQLFEKLVVKTYSDRFALYTGEGFQAKSFRAEGDKDFIVSSVIVHPNGSAPTQVDWRLRAKDGGYKIIDVIIEGVGMSVTQHQEFASIIQRNGGEIAPLLTEMRNRVGSK